MNWKLPAGTGAKPGAATRTASAAPEKMVCRRTARIGSLAGSTKTCMTKSEWARTTGRTQHEWSQRQGGRARWDGQVGP